MKVRFMGFAALVIAAALAFSNPALAGCGKKSKPRSESNSERMQDMEMNDEEMPMCCKMKMDHSKMKGHESKGGPEEDGAVEEPGGKEVKDPVCSMMVDTKTAEKAVYKGKTYYFCSKEDKAKFKKSPAKYIKPDKSKMEGHESKAEQGITEVEDPVCSMTVDPKTAEKAVLEGKTYYFCSKEDKAKFEKSPENYVRPDKRDK